MFNPRLAETSFAHPGGAVLTGVIKTTGRFDQHVQTHEESKRVLPAFVIDQGLKHDQSTTVGQRPVRLVEQHALLIEIPVVEDVTHGDHIRGRKRLIKEIARLKLESFAQTIRGHVFFEDWRNDREVEVRSLR